MDPLRRGLAIGAAAGVVVCAIVAAWAFLFFGLTFEGDRATIPASIIGKRFDLAKGVLQARGFDNVETPGAGYAFGLPTKVGDVIPSPGTEVEKDTTITLLIQTPSKTKTGSGSK